MFPAPGRDTGEVVSRDSVIRVFYTGKDASDVKKWTGIPIRGNAGYALHPGSP